MIVTKTPYRISMFGGGTDHPAWFKNNGGSVVSFSIDKYCHLFLGAAEQNQSYNYRIEYSKVETVMEISKIQHPAVHHAFKKYAGNLRLSLTHKGDLPARSGVGSSSAFAVGLIKAMYVLNGMQISAQDLAKEAIEFEQFELNEVVGSQDQIACALGGINFIKFYGEKDWDAKSIKLSDKYKADLESRMVLMYSGMSRNSSDVSKSLLKDLGSKSHILARVENLALQFKEILTKELDLDLVTELMLENWSLKMNSNPEAITPKLENFYEHARKNGALAGKILGAGGGGFFLFWVHPGWRERFINNMSPLRYVPFNITSKGCRQVL